MKALRLGLDMDGLFSDFNTSFAKQLVSTVGKDLIPQPFTPISYNWYKDFGYLKSEIDATWADVDRDPLWWYHLAAYDHHACRVFMTTLSELHSQGKVIPYFLTTRHSPSAHWQTTQWLADRGLTVPHVVITANQESKGLICRALELTVMVDDFPSNLDAVKAHSPATKTYLVEQPYNRRDRDRGYTDVLPADIELLRLMVVDWTNGKPPAI